MYLSPNGILIYVVTTHRGSDIRTVALRIINMEQLVMVDLMLLFGSDE
jgi:hypothetical protein